MSKTSDKAYLTSLKFKKDFPPFLENMTWENIPRFAVLTGENGAGKSRLLNVILNHLTKRRIDRPDLDIIEIDLPKATKNVIYIPKVIYIPIDFDFKKLTLDKPNTDLAARARNRNSHVITDIINKPENYSSFVEELETRTGKEFKEISPRLISANLPFDRVLSFNLTEDSSYIMELFDLFQQKVINFKLERLDQNKPNLTNEEIYNELGMLPPWDVINALFEQYQLDYQMACPEPDTIYVPAFINNKGDAIQYAQLSDGERIIVTLILWGYNHFLSNKNMLFLLDEIDAHLNPKLSKMLIDIVKTKLVEEFGLQVIMTTHTVSTVAYVDESNLFWLKKDEGIIPGDKSKIISRLSDGLMTYEDGIEILINAWKSSEKIVLFTEGPTDCLHIKEALKKLNFTTFFDVFPASDKNSGGYSKLFGFLTHIPDVLMKNKIFIGIFDPDSSAQFIKTKFNQKKLSYQSTANKHVFAVILPMNENFSKFKTGEIEFLYPRKTLEKYGILGNKIPFEKILRKDFNKVEYEDCNELYLYDINDNMKTKFAEEIVPTLPPGDLENFRELFNIIKSIGAVLAQPDEEIIEV